jgi:tetratricopeptide (TPR) repeat protein
VKNESGRRLRDQIKDRVLKMAEKDPDTAAILNDLLELQGWWLTDSESDLSQVKVLSILAKARGKDETAGLNEAIEATPTSPFFTALFKEAVRIAKPADGKALMKRLAAKADQLPQADREVVFAAYGPSLISDVQSALKLDPPNWKTLKAACDDAKPVVPNDPWVAVASAEVLATQEPKDLTKAASLVKSAALAQPYRQYVEAIVSASDDAAGAADKLVAVYPAKGNADPVVNIAARREIASQLLTSAMKAKLKETRNPFEFPFEADDAEKVSRWIDTVTRINPSNQEALIYATLVAEIGPKPNPEQVKNLLQQLSKSWPNDKTAGSFAFILNLLRADSLAGSNTPAERVDALGLYCDTLERLRLADERLREKAAMKKAQSYVDRAIDFGKQLKQTNNATPAAMNRLAQLYGLRAEWINSNRIDWGFDNEEAAWAACLSDYKSALGLVGDGFDKAGYLAGRIYFDYKLKKLDEQAAEIEAEAARGIAPKNPRPYGLLGTLKMIRARELMAKGKNREECNNLYDSALSHFESAIKLCKPPIDNLRKAIFLDNAARICRHLATDGIRETENREKVEKYETEAAELRVFDDALEWSSRGRSLEDRAWPRGDRTLYTAAVTAFDKAIGHEPKPHFYMERGRITLRGVIYGGRNWTDLNKARADLTRAATHNDATPLTKAEAWYYLSQLESVDRKSKASAEAFQKFWTAVPNDATSFRLVYPTYRGYVLAVEMESLKQNRKEIPADLIKQMEAVAEKLPASDRYTIAWLRGTAKSFEKGADPKSVAEIFVKALPSDFPKLDSLKLKADKLKADEKKDTGAWSCGLPLLGWLKLYLENNANIDAKGDITPARLVEAANVLTGLLDSTNNQDVWLRAAGMAIAGQAHIKAAGLPGVLPDQEYVYRDRAIALLREAVDVLHPQFPTTWEWRRDLARELARSINRPNYPIPAGERKKRLDEARTLFTQAKDEAPSDARSGIIDELQRLPRG